MEELQPTPALYVKDSVLEILPKPASSCSKCLKLSFSLRIYLFPSHHKPFRSMHLVKGGNFTDTRALYALAQA